MASRILSNIFTSSGYRRHLYVTKMHIVIVCLFVFLLSLRLYLCVFVILCALGNIGCICSALGHVWNFKQFNSCFLKNL